MVKKSWACRTTLLFAGVLVVTSCGGGDSEPSSRQRNTAIACVSAALEGALQLGTSGGDAVVNVGACAGTVSLEFFRDGERIGDPTPFSEGGTVPLTVRLPEIGSGNTESVSTVTVRAMGADQRVLAEDVLTVRLNEGGDVSVAVTAGIPTTTPETTSQPESSSSSPVTSTEEPSQEPAASVGRDPVPPTDLVMAENTDALAWVPARPSTDGHQFNAETYPYRYRVKWRQSGKDDAFSNFVDAEGTQFDWVSQSNEGDWFLPDTAYEFIVEEHLYGGDGQFVSSSAPSAAIVATPYTAEEFAKDEAERVAREAASREAAAECLKTAPKLELLLVDPENRQGDPTAPVNSDDRVKFGLLHPCAQDRVARLVFSFREIDPVSRRVFRKDIRAGGEDDLAFRVPNERLSPGKHTVVVEASWYLNDQPSEGGAPLPQPSTEWTFEVAQGTEPFPQRCFVDKFSLEGRTLTIDCEVTRVRWRNSDIPSRNVGFSRDKRVVTLPVLPDGWNRFSLNVSQKFYGSSVFDFMVCQRNCDNAKLEPEFGVTLDGDTANISIKQNSCGGNPQARISEFVKISDNLYYSYNRAFGEASPRVKEDSPLSLALKPFTGALRAQRRDFCGQRRTTVYSFTTLSRTSVAPLALEAMPPSVQQEVIVEPEDVVSAAQPVIQVPANADTLVVSDEILTALARTGGTVTVKIDDGEPEEIVADADLTLELPRTAKKITFRATDKDGQVTEVSKPIMQVSEPEKVQVLVEDAGETVPQVEPSQAGPAGDSGSRTGLFAGIVALLVALLAAAALVVRRRKAVTQ